MARFIVVVEGGIVQNVASREHLDYDVLDHDAFEECAHTRGHIDSWWHEADCPDHMPEEWADYLALCREADALDGVAADA